MRRFNGWRTQAGLPKPPAVFNIFYENPNATPPEDFRLGVGVATNREVPPNDVGVTAMVIPGGRCAVLRHVGAEESFGEAIRDLYKNWLPESGEELRDFPLYCQRVTFFPDVAQHEAVTDIFCRSDNEMAARSDPSRLIRFCLPFAGMQP